VTPILDDLEQALQDTPSAQIPELIGLLATLQARAQVRLMQRDSVPTPLPDAGRYLSVEQVAERFHVTARWIYRHKKQMPHSQPSRKLLLFPEGAIQRWFARKTQ
jgi:hypothetical protein